MTDRPLLTKSMQRGLANNPQQRASVMNDVEGVFNPNIPFSKKPNARYGPAVFHVIMMGVAALGASIFGYTEGRTEMDDSLMHACQRPPRVFVRGVDYQHLSKG